MDFPRLTAPETFALALAWINRGGDCRSFIIERASAIRSLSTAGDSALIERLADDIGRLQLAYSRRPLFIPGWADAIWMLKPQAWANILMHAPMVPRECFGCLGETAEQVAARWNHTHDTRSYRLSAEDIIAPATSLRLAA